MDHAKNFKMRMQRKRFFFDLQNNLKKNRREVILKDISDRNGGVYAVPPCITCKINAWKQIEGKIQWLPL